MPQPSLRRNLHSIRSPRRPFSRVVVGLDSSAAAERTVAFALSIARGDVRTEVVFCRVIDVPLMLARADRFAEDYEIGIEAARADARTSLDRALVLAREAGVFARSYIRYGKPATEIVSLAERSAADLIVIGNRPRAKLRRVLCGSVRDELVRTSGVPVLAMDANPARPAEFGASCILVQLAPPQVSPAPWHLASGLAAAYGRRLMCLPPCDRNARAAAATLEKAVAEYRPAMIVIGAAAQGRLHDLFSPSIVERALQAADAPVLVVRERDEIGRCMQLDEDKSAL